MIRLDTDQHGWPQFVCILADDGTPIRIPAANARSALLHAAAAEDRIAAQQRTIRELCCRNAEIVAQAALLARAYQKQRRDLATARIMQRHYEQQLAFAQRRLARLDALDPAAPWRAKEATK